MIYVKAAGWIAIGELTTFTVAAATTSYFKTLLPIRAGHSFEQGGWPEFSFSMMILGAVCAIHGLVGLTTLIILSRFWTIHILDFRLVLLAAGVAMGGAALAFGSDIPTTIMIPIAIVYPVLCGYDYYISRKGI